MRALFLCILAAGVGAGSSTMAHPLEPLGLRTQGTLRELFLDITLADARALERPEADLRFSISNVWNEQMTLTRHADVATQLLDAQADAVTVHLRFPWASLAGEGPATLPGSPRPLFRRLTTAAELRATEHWGGWTDGPIEAWHRLVGAFDFDRDLHPRNRIRLLARDSGGTAFDLDHPTFALGDLALRTQLVLAEGGAPLVLREGRGAPSRWGLSGRLDLKLPTGSLARAGGSGKIDAGVAVLATTELSAAVALHGLVGLSRFSSLGGGLLLQPRPWHFTFEASLALDLGPLQLLLEDRALTPLLQAGWNRVEEGGNNGYLSSGYAAGFRAHNQVSIGLRRGLFSLWMSEDFTPGPNPRATSPLWYESNSPDVTVGLAFTSRL